MSTIIREKLERGKSEEITIVVDGGLQHAAAQVRVENDDVFFTPAYLANAGRTGEKRIKLDTITQVGINSDDDER